MPKTRLQKSEILRTLKEKVKKSKSLFFARYSRMTVEESEKLRSDLRKESGEFLVAKKTLINLALADAGIKGVDAKTLEGQVGIIFGYGDEVAPVKEASKFIKEKEGKLEFLAGILEGKTLAAEEVKMLATLPSKTELYAKIVGSINAPVSGFVNALAGNLRNLVYVLKAVEEKKTN
jgi:large subunit ribosomal protein L10